jgi:hypothetical protein
MSNTATQPRKETLVLRKDAGNEQKAKFELHVGDISSRPITHLGVAFGRSVADKNEAKKPNGLFSSIEKETRILHPEAQGIHNLKIEAVPIAGSFHESLVIWSGDAFSLKP